jgi:hypothetical protein
MQFALGKEEALRERQRFLTICAALGSSFYSRHVFLLLSKNEAEQARANWPGRTQNISPLIRQHFFQLRLVGGIRHYALVKFTFPRARFRGQDMTAKGTITNNLAGAGLLEPFGRTLVCL